MKHYLALPESERAWAVMVARWEREICYQADYVLGTSVRHPVCDMRAARRATDLAQARALVIGLHPLITRGVLEDVHPHLSVATHTPECG